nr:DNA polymerase III subunit alpha [Bacteroidota bacterium]
MYLIFDTETTGLPRNGNAPLTDFENWPRLVQIAWQIHDAEGNLLELDNHIVKPDGFTIPYNAEKVHGISTKMATEQGHDLHEVLVKFLEVLDKCTHVAGHNVEFDVKIVGSELLRNGLNNALEKKKVLDTMIESTAWCALPGGRGGGFKYPSLIELYQKLFNESFQNAHNAAADVIATARCFLELIRTGIITEKQLVVDKEIVEKFKTIHTHQIQPVDIDVESNKKISDKLAGEEDTQVPIIPVEELVDSTTYASFSHLHVHSYYSVLQAAPSIQSLVAKAVEFGMPALAITDHGNLFGAYAFIKEASKNNIKPIIGCEFYLVKDRKKQKFTKDNPDRRYNQVLLAKNMDGYRNLSKLSSLAWIEGNYAQYPRIDREILLKYKDNLIATTGGLKSEVCDLILNVGEHQAEEAFKWWVDEFGEDFYIQLNRHDLKEEDHVNRVLLEFSKKYHVKVIAANNVYYVEEQDNDLHDSLICIQKNEYQSTPIGRGRGTRFGFPNHEFWMKSQEGMARLFADIPEAISNVEEILGKIETYTLDRDPLMPDFQIPDGFINADEYLRHLAYEGAKYRYGEVSKEITERIDYELSTIKGMGYPGYFLIVHDVLNEARKMGVWVGPGRGSAAGSVVAYCLKITDLDPLKFGLLFERFLNPDRISLPDIDIDFDEDGREKVLKWVVNKYGAQRVAHIITFGKMAPKMAIRDIARVKELSLSEANRLAKLVPEDPGTTFEKAYKKVPELVREKHSTNPLLTATLLTAERVEGTVRNIGTHACGIIIGKEDLIEHIPLSTSKESDLLVTQFEGKQIENVGMLKMDFLGLKTLAIIKDALENIKKSKGETLDIENISYEDDITFQLFSRGDTSAIFQFESDGMKN